MPTRQDENVLKQFSRLLYSAATLRLERDWLYQHFPISATIGGEEVECSARDLKEHFGRLIPYWNYKKDGVHNGIGRKLLALGHPVIENNDQTWIDTGVSEPISYMDTVNL